MLEKQISEKLKQSLKEGQKVRVSVLRMLISEVNYRKIADRVKELDDDKVISVIKKLVKQHKESIEKFRQGGREELVEKEEAELEILEEYLPEQIPQEELAKIIEESVKQTGAVTARDMGKVMADVMTKTKGQADGKVVGEMVKKRLG